MAVTINDIAKACNVSRGTVYRALNNTGRINSDTKKRILDTAEKLNYTPNLLARSLVKVKSMCIGIVVFDVQNRYFAQLLNAIEHHAKAHGYFVSITLHENDPEMEKELIRGLVGRQMDGLILCPTNKGIEFEKYLNTLAVPIVVVGNMVSDHIPFTGLDEYKAAFDTVKYIATKDYHHIIFVCPSLADAHTSNMYSHEQRLKGFNDAIESLDNPNSSIIDTWDYCERVKDTIVNTEEKIAFFCSGDTFALEIMKYLRQYDINTPEDYGLIGFDNIDTLSYVTPSLSTVYNPIEEIGTTAVDQILKLINHEPIENKIFIDHKIIDGETL